MAAKVHDDSALCSWERSYCISQARIDRNLHFMVYYRDTARAKENPHRAPGNRFYGKARIVTSGPERDRAWS